MICFVCETAYGKISWEIFNYGIKNISMIYSQTCIKRSPLGQRKRWPFDTGDCLIQVTAWVGLTVHVHVHIVLVMYRILKATNHNGLVRTLVLKNM